jgi:hypothetical protein
VSGALLDRVLAAAPDLAAFDRAAVETALGVTLTEIETSPSFTRLEHPGEGAVSAIELRAPGPQATFGGLLLVRLRPGVLSVDALRARLGAPPILSLDVPSPGLAPPGSAPPPQPGCVDYLVRPGRNDLWLRVEGDWASGFSVHAA